MSDTLANVKKFTFSNFTNCEEQRQGGEATVYKGLSGEYGDVAIKEFFIEVKVDDMSEVELLVKHCHHPNIVQLYGVLVADMSSPLIQGYVMEYMPNGSLEDVIHNPAQSYSWNEISSWIQQISRGLGYLHGRKIIHRDIKPSNLLLGNGLKTLKISDFGLAKQVDVGSHTSEIGTCWYMAPEVIQTRKYSFSADIYSLAITIWELYSRRRPYYHLNHSSDYNLLRDVVGGERPLLDGSVDERVVAFLKRAWTANPDQRPALTEFLTFAETADVQINWNIKGQCLDNATSSDIRPNALATALQAKVEERITKAVTRISEHLSTVLIHLNEAPLEVKSAEDLKETLLERMSFGKKASKGASSADFLHHYFMFSSFCELHKKKPLSQWVFSEPTKLEEFKQQINELMKQLNSDLFGEVCHWGSENATLLRATRSGLQFLKDDFEDDETICKLFGNFEEEGYSLYEIDQKLEYLKGKRRDWDDGSDPVDLRGVPDSHNWWSQLERDDSEGTFGKQ